MKKLFSFMRAYRREAVLGPLFKLAEALFELFVPLVVAAMIDRGIGGGDRGYIWGMTGILFLLGAVGLLFSVTAQYFAARASVGTVSRMRHALFAHMGRLSHTELDGLGQATMMTRMTSDMNQVQTGLNLALRLLLRSPFVVFGAMIMAFTIDFSSALVFAGTIPALAVVVFAIMLISIPLYKRVQSRLDRVMLLVRENLGGARVIRAFSREGEEVESFAEANRGLTRSGLLVGRISALMNPLTYVIVNLGVILLLRIGALSVSAGSLTTGEVVALYNYMSQILVELVKLASLIITITKSIASARRASAILDIPLNTEEGEEIPAPVVGAPRLAFLNVSLAYRGAGADAVSDVSFSANAGETVGIIGGTGSGKSSLISMITRAYDPREGEILLDGVPLAKYPLRALRSRIGIVPQNVQLFRATVRDNIRVGKKDATDEEIWAALETAQAAGFVREKAGGLDAPVEAGGKNLSGGQRQRLTIARALVRRPDILILDDSTSALDFATDAALRRGIRELDYAPLLLLVSQRTSSIVHANRILVMDDGEVVGQGTHEALLDSCEVYREIYDSQYRKEGA